MNNLHAQQKLVTDAWIEDVGVVMTAISGFTKRRALQNACRVVLFELAGDRDLHVNVTHEHHTASPALISTTGPSQTPVRPTPAVTTKRWPPGCVCQAERAPGSKVTKTVL